MGRTFESTRITAASGVPVAAPRALTLRALNVRLIELTACTALPEPIARFAVQVIADADGRAKPPLPALMAGALRTTVLVLTTACAVPFGTALAALHAIVLFATLTRPLPVSTADGALKLIALALAES